MYYDASAPGRCLAPDAFVKLGVPQTMLPCWKTWLSGAPELCVEILSSCSEEKLTLETKLKRYRALGARELILFDLDQPKGERLRAWDRIQVGFEEEFVERVVEDETTPCLTLGAHWILVPAKMFDPLFKDTMALRLADDRAGIGLWLTWFESRRRARGEL